MPRIFLSKVVRVSLTGEDRARTSIRFFFSRGTRSSSIQPVKKILTQGRYHTYSPSFVPHPSRARLLMISPSRGEPGEWLCAVSSQWKSSHSESPRLADKRSQWRTGLNWSYVLDLGHDVSAPRWRDPSCVCSSVRLEIFVFRFVREGILKIMKYRLGLVQLMPFAGKNKL